MSRLIDHPSVDQDFDLVDHDLSNNVDPFGDQETYRENPYGSHTNSGQQQQHHHQQHYGRPSMSDPYLVPVDSYRSYLDGAGVAADIEGDDFMDIDRGEAVHGTSSRPKSGLTAMYANVKSKLGMSQNAEYSEMDLPLTDMSKHTGRIATYDNSSEGIGGGSRSTGTGKRRKGAKEGSAVEPDRDFDIRRIFHRLIGRRTAQPSGPRIVSINDGPANSPYGYQGNHISTTKYNIATFIPKFLFEQFSKYANLFFLCTSAIQQVPGVTPTNRYTTIGTLAVVLCVSAVKELVEDFKRSNADKELNSSRVEVLVDGRFQEVKWVKVKVGDVLRVKSEEPFPADLLLLASSEPEGLCYIETANLDGETNLKIKQARTETSHLVSERQLADLDGKIFSEQPNSSLYTYEATLEMAPNLKIPLSPDQLLLRGATLRNTPWIHGVVVFTGHETKLMRNATAAPIKRTAVEHMINLQIIFLFTILIVLAVVSSLGNVITIHNTTKKAWYLRLAGVNLVKQFFADILTYWILFSNLVPIR